MHNTIVSVQQAKLTVLDLKIHSQIFQCYFNNVYKQI